MSGNLATENAGRLGCQRLAERFVVRILNGTVVELETTHAISSKDVRLGDAISFRVACPVIVEEVTVIAAGTVAMGVITGVEKYGRYGRPDKIACSVKEVMAVDGTSIPLQLSVMLSDSEDLRTDEREMAAASLMFPVAPLALVFLSRRREKTVIRSGLRFRAFMREDIEVSFRRVKNV